jgi:hypothetical protein
VFEDGQIYRANFWVGPWLCDFAEVRLGVVDLGYALFRMRVSEDSPSRHLGEQTSAYAPKPARWHHARGVHP